MKIICSAIKMKDGYIIKGHRHNDCLMTASRIPKYSKNDVEEQGFVTSDDGFVSREDARIIHETFLTNNGGIKKPFQHDTLLFSEDIY